MADNRNIKINTPGENPEADDALEVGAGDQTDEGVDDEFEARVEAETQRRVAAALAKQAKSQTTKSGGPLPDQSEVDATKIKRSVLTKQGWVVPAPPPLDEATEALRKVMAR
jgi:hypothetical protein